MRGTNHLIREGTVIDGENRDRVLLPPVQLVQKVGIGYEVAIRDRYASSIAFRRLVVGLGLLGGQLKAGQQLQQGPPLPSLSNSLETQE